MGTTTSTEMAIATQPTIALERVMSRSFVVIGNRWTSARALGFLRGVRTTHVVILRIEDNGERFVYLRPRREAVADLRAAPAQTIVHAVFKLHEYTADAQREPGSDASDAPPVAVVVAGTAVLGFLDAREPPAAAARSGSFAYTGRLPPAQRPFRAYPALSAPEQADIGTPFDIFVGFRSTPDRSLGESKMIEVTSPVPDKSCLVLLSGDGMTLDREHDSVPLREDVVVRFTGTLGPGIEVGSVKVHFVYDQQVIGGARREVRATTAALQPTPPLSGQARPNPCRMAEPGATTGVDFTVSVTHLSGGTLSWRFVVPACPGHDTTLKRATRLGDSSEFAASLMQDLRAVKFRGPLARNVLDTVGRSVAALIPPEFFTLLAEVHKAIGRVPTLLWLTDEVYVPWELATLDTPLDAAAPPFLAAQTLMGRWLDDEQVMLPPASSVDVQRMSVVASEYGLASGQRKLTDALAERDHLCDRWRGQPLEATVADLTALASGAKLSGHLVHFAVHGFSDPVGNAQSMLLSDKTQLPASALVGGHRCGELPRFSFVFLNACQVGTPGRTLGQAGGFPGALLRGGAKGFIAPLWDVDDLDARALAEAFYDDVFVQNRSVGEALHAYRLCYAGDSTTSVAYLYYGHPALALRRAA
jgi:hypothetical protein